MVLPKTKILIIFSVVLNATLLSFLFGLVPFLLYLSVVINLMLAWFSFRLIRAANDTQEEVSNMFRKLEDYADHLEKIHSMEMFYGEPVLQDLIDHSRNLVNGMIDFQEKFYDYETVEEEYASDEETSEEEE